MTSTARHKKHADIARPALGEFHRNELAIIGAPCSEIQKLANQLIDILGQEMRIAYVDADHSENDSESWVGYANFTDKISFNRFDTKAGLNKFQRRSLFNTCDLVLVNGNHFKAKNQVVVIHQAKEESLSRKLDRLTDVSMVLLENESSEVYPFLVDVLPENVPVLKLCEDAQIADWIRAWMLERRSSVRGLVLSGGKSQRLGRDKTIIDYHGRPQKDWLYDMLREHCDDVHLSVRPDQSTDSDGQQSIADSFINLGPFGGILSAFREYPDQAWLVVASDLPLVDSEVISYLLSKRNTSKLATAFLNPKTGFADPLITIWEPRAYPVLLSFMAQGYSCPRKVLINSDIELLDVPDENWLLNVNTQEDLDRVQEILLAKTK